MALTKQEKKEHCSGCQDNFYNGNNTLNIKECLLLKTAKLVRRYKIYWWTSMDKASNFTEVKVLSCYHDNKDGQGHAYLENIPNNLRQEWKELHRQLNGKKKE